MLQRHAVLVAILLLPAGCSSSGERQAASVPSEIDWLCVELRRGEPMQRGLDYYGLFLVNGSFIDGVSFVNFDSAAATASVKLKSGINGDEWVTTLPTDYFDPRIVERWQVSDEECE